MMVQKLTANIIMRNRLIIFLLTSTYVTSQPTQDLDQCAEQDTCVQYMINKVDSNLQLLEQKVNLMQEDMKKLKTENEDLKMKISELNSTKQDATKFKDCSDLKTSGTNKSGVYTIYPKDKNNQEYRVEVFCDMETDGGGWTIFQRRLDGSVLFNQSWIAYRDGFGNIRGEFWLGNKYLHLLTMQSSAYHLRIDLKAFNGMTSYAIYRDFKVSSEAEYFKLTVGNYSGNAGDSLTFHNNQMFSTHDEDHDANRFISCSANEGGDGGFWFSNCQYANMNAIYYSSAQSVLNSVHWNSWRGWESLKETRMMFRQSKGDF